MSRMKIAATSVAAMSLLLAGCGTSSATPAPNRTPIPDDKAASYFLDIICPTQKVIEAQPTSSDVDEMHAWATNVQAAVKKASEGIDEPGGDWPESVGPEIRSYWSMISEWYDGWMDQVLQQKTATGMESVSMPPSVPEGGHEKQDQLSKKLDVDLGSDATCDGHA